MAEYLPKFKPGESITLQTPAPAAITGGQLVTAASAVAGAGATDWVGVASRDVPAGALPGVYCDGVQRLIASAAIAQGALVKCAANGQVAPLVVGTDGFQTYVGKALEAAAGAGSLIAVKL